MFGSGTTEYLHTVGSIKNWTTTLENNLALSCKLMEHLPYNSASLFLGIYPEETLIMCNIQGYVQ